MAGSSGARRAKASRCTGAAGETVGSLTLREDEVADLDWNDPEDDHFRDDFTWFDVGGISIGVGTIGS
jgi:hypothetical protein